MLETAQKALKAMRREGAGQAEAFVAENSVLTVRIASNRIIETKFVRDEGMGLRAAVGQRVGFACANEFTPELAKRAVSIARARPPNPDFNGFPTPTKPKRVRGIYDSALASLPPERAAEIAESMLVSALCFDDRVAEVSGALNVVVERCAIANSNGVIIADRATRMLGHLTVEARDLGRSEGAAWLGSTNLRDFDPSAVGRRAAELAVGSLNPKKVKPGNYDVILEPAATAELLYHVLGYAVNGRDVHDGISYFADHLGKDIAAEELSICDWGNMSNGQCSKTFDDEGVPTQRTSLIERGRLVGFVYDRYYAGKAGMRSTGNGLRLADMPGRCYGVEPSPCITNLVLSPGDFKREELIADTKRGLLLSRIWYTYPITPQIGDFSTTSRCGFLVRGGELVGAAGQVRIHENMPRILRRVTGIADDVEQVMPWGAVAAICAPSLRLSGVRVE
ncbi:MAG: TldD/PmbA family protein [Candidatus Hodarchaeaceae archaeon]|nr:TldD/PmbA family protein [Candidatus Hodarchaeaceae archaeon]